MGSGNARPNLFHELKMEVIAGELSLVVDGQPGSRKITGTEMTIGTGEKRYHLYLPISSWSPSPILFLTVGQKYHIGIQKHKDGTLALIKVEGTRLSFAKV